jgi:hypothetical protein
MVFTKLLKPALSALREQGIRIVMFIDDSLIMAQGADILQQHLEILVTLFHSLGFIINWEKSCLHPKQIIEFLGLLIDSIKMTTCLPEEKLVKIQKESRHLMKRERVSARELAQMVGLFTFTLPAVLPAPLRYRNLQRCRTSILTT